MSDRLTKEREQEIRGRRLQKEGESHTYPDPDIQELFKTIDALRADKACTIGVGGGSGKLFVHGDYESIKQCQTLILERDELNSLLKNVTSLTFPGETDSVDAMLKIKKERDALKVENERLNTYWKTHDARWVEMTEENQELKTENETLQQMAGRSVEIASELRESNEELKVENEEMKSNLLHCKLTLFGGKSASELMSENRDLRDELDGETNWAFIAGNFEKENQKLRERIAKMRDALLEIREEPNQLQCGIDELDEIAEDLGISAWNIADKALAQDSEAEGKE